jgi:SNF2 family DNA or RNA helicase
LSEIELSIENGLFVLKANTKYYPTIEELYSYEFSNEAISGFKKENIRKSNLVKNIKFRRKPTRLHYVTQAGKLIPKCNDNVLIEEQWNSLIEYGYVLLDGKVYSCSPDDRLLLESTISTTNLRDQLSVLGKLHSKNLLNGETQQILEIFRKQHFSKLLIEKKDGVFNADLYPYQKTGVKWLVYCYFNKVGTILGDDMGLGKTAQVIALIAECRERSALKNTVIIVPNSLLENWKREFEFFCPSIVPYIHNGSIRTGLSENLEEYDVVIIPYSIISHDIEMLSQLTPDLLVFDEASLLKNPESNRTVAAKRIKAACTVAMTGTPVENSLMDLWSIVDLVFPGYLGGKREYSERYIEKTIDETLEKDLSDLESLVNQILIRRMKADVLQDLPSKIDIDQPILMSGKEKEIYDGIVNTIKSEKSSHEHILQSINLLQQYTSHPALLNETINFDFNSLKSSSAKFTRLFELLDVIEARNEKVLIFANHIKTIDILIYAVREKYSLPVFSIDGRVDIDERVNQIDSFSTIEGFSAMILNPTTAGMGLNITAANHVIHYSRQWNPALEEQATARAYRNKQSKEVNVYYMFYADTIEEVIDERLRKKRQLSSRIINAVDDKKNEMDVMLKYIEEIRS